METYIKLLKQYIAIKSISTDLTFKKEMGKTVLWLTSLFKQNKFVVTTIQGKNSNPIVIARYTASPKFETVLIYGHYDVQPASKEDGWKSDPFTLRSDGKKLYGRGVVDNKGQHLIHVVTIFDLIQKNKLKYNVVFMIEGNEETSNSDMRGLVSKYKKLLSCDHIIISDGEICGNTPTLEASLRGGFNMTVNLRTGKNNLHSGLAGGAVPNAAHEASKLVEKLFANGNTISIPGFYQGIDPITKSQKVNNRAISTDKEAQKLFGVKALLCEEGFDCHTQVGLRPTIQVTGIHSGYTKEGYSNIVPAQSEVRLNIRLVAPQDPEKIWNMITKFIKAKVPKYTEVSFSRTDGYKPIKVNIDSKKSQETHLCLTRAYGKKPIIKYVGGGIPIVSDFKDILGIDTLLVSLGNDDCNMHSVDENYTIGHVKKGLEFSRLFFSK